MLGFCSHISKRKNLLLFIKNYAANVFYVLTVYGEYSERRSGQNDNHQVPRSACTYNFEEFILDIFLLLYNLKQILYFSLLYIYLTALFSNYIADLG